MTKLSEIGREEWDQIDPDNINVKIVLTLGERREFARALIAAWNKKLYGERRATIPDISEFLEEQGL